MLRLQEDGVHFIGWVSPSHVVPGLLKSLSIARERGLEIPIIYYTNGYDALATLKLLDGFVHIELILFVFMNLITKYILLVVGRVMMKMMNLSL